MLWMFMVHWAWKLPVLHGCDVSSWVHAMAQQRLVSMQRSRASSYSGAARGNSGAYSGSDPGAARADSGAYGGSDSSASDSRANSGAYSGSDSGAAHADSGAHGGSDSSASNSRANSGADVAANSGACAAYASAHSTKSNADCVRNLLRLLVVHWGLLHGRDDGGRMHALAGQHVVSLLGDPYAGSSNPASANSRPFDSGSNAGAARDDCKPYSSPSRADSRPFAAIPIASASLIRQRVLLHELGAVPIWAHQQGQGRVRVGLGPGSLLPLHVRLCNCHPRLQSQE